MKKIILFVVCFFISSLNVVALENDNVVGVRSENNILVARQIGEQFYSVKTTAQVTLTKKDLNTYEIVRCRETKVKVYDVTRGKYIEENGSDILIIGSSGQLTLEKNLEEGEYLIEEIEAPAGYIKKKYPQTFYVESNMGPIINIDIYNQPIDYNIELRTKGEIYVGVEEDDGKLKGKYDIRGIDNVKYGLYARENILDGAGNIIYNKDSIVTYINIEMGLASVHELPYGYYYLKELECPDEFIIEDKLIEIDLTGEARFISIELINTTKKGNIVIHKTDGEIGLQGAEFILYDEKYQYPINIVTDNFGYSIIENVPYDKYFLKETKAPIGYLIDNEQKIIVFQEKNLEYNLINEKEPIEKPGDDEDVEEKEPIEKPDDDEVTEEKEPIEKPGDDEDTEEKEPIEKPGDDEDAEEKEPIEKPGADEDAEEKEPIEKPGDDEDTEEKDSIEGSNDEIVDENESIDAEQPKLEESKPLDEPSDNITDEDLDKNDDQEIASDDKLDNNIVDREKENINNDNEISNKYVNVVVENPNTAVTKNNSFLNIVVLLCILVVFYTFKA